MRSMVKWTGALLLLLLLGQLALWYAASRAFAGLAEDVSPVAELSYDSTFAWPSGRAGMRLVRIRPHMAPTEEMVAQSVSFRTGGPLAMFSLLRHGVDKAPDYLSVRIERLRLSAVSEQRLRAQASRLGYLAPFEALGCNDQGRFGGTDYAELAWLHNQADIDLQMAADGGRGDVALRMGYDMQPLARLDLEIDVAGGAAAGAPALAQLTSSRLTRILVRFQDRGMIAQRNAYCAQRQSASAGEFLDHHMAAVAAELEARGVFLDEPVLAVYRGFAERGGSLELTAAPTSTIDFSQYRHYRPEDRLRMANAGLSHDGGPRVPVTARFFAAGTAGSAATPTSPGAAPPASDSVRVQVDATSADDLLFEELADMVGRKVAIETVQKVDYVGTLLGTQGPLVRIEIDRRGARPQRIALSRDNIVRMRLLD